jgi:hypothetical protein
MTVQNIGAGVSLTGASPGGKLFLPGASAFADNLSIGQILQGKVLRGYDENRYLVAFGSDERVVDSAIPLTAGEILYGRVVGLGDRVELQRVYSNSQDKSSPRESVPVDPRPPLSATASNSAVDNILQRYRIELTDADRASLVRAARTADDPEAMGLAGAMLSKLGLPQSSVLLEAMYRAQFATGGAPSTAGAIERESLPQVVAAWGQGEPLQGNSIQQLADLVGRILEGKNNAADRPPPSATTSQATQGFQAAVQYTPDRRQPDLQADDESRRRVQESLAARILNAQTGGVVAHRSGLLPLLVGGKLVEVSFALFEQRRPASQAQGLQHRQVVFSLHTEQMGRVDVLARITGGHVRVQITTDSEERTSQTARYADLLKGSLSESGWNVDEVAYGTRAENPHSAVVRSVIEHVVSLDSLNRLV